MTRPFVSGLVLAAGTSSWLGQPKQLLPFGSTTLLGHVVAEARTAHTLDERIVIIGAAADAVRRQVDLAGVTVVQTQNLARAAPPPIARGSRRSTPEPTR